MRSKIIDGTKHVYLDMEKDCRAFLDAHDIQPDKRVTCPMGSKAALYADGTLVDEEDASFFRSGLGSLMYYTVALPKFMPYQKPCEKLSYFSGG